MSLAEIRAQIKQTFQIADPGSLVHDYERFPDPTRPDQLKALFQPATDGPFRAWVFRPTSRQSFVLSRDSVLVVRMFVVRLIHSVKDADASEKSLWDDVIEPVSRAFVANAAVGGFNWSPVITEGPLAGLIGLQIDRVDYLMFGSAFCHYGEGRLAVQELQTITH